MTKLLPVLRSPPFPHVAPDVAAVSSFTSIPTPRGSLTQQERGRARLIADAIGKARIGGIFWGAHPAKVSADRQDIDPWHSLERFAPAAYAGDDEAGLIAAIAGHNPTWTSTGRFGDAFADGLPDPIERLITAWLIDAVAYRDPYSGRPVAIESAIEQLAFWRQAIDRNRGIAVATGMARWKRREVEAMLWAGAPLRFESRAGAAAKLARSSGGAIANWATRTPAGLAEAARNSGVPIYPVEDGFLRSAGLGSECHPPHSITLDRTGLHLDPAGPCDLEALIASVLDDPQLLRRAQQLQRVIIAEGISKYGAGGSGFERPAEARRLVLIAGQVENDLSVKLGGAGIASNLELIRRARGAEPDAYLMFKPHPDVDRGHRPGKIADDIALRHVDRVIRDVPMASLLDAVDAVHVLTSLTGFEALLRGCEVIVHGQPFYAGWGLTRDLSPPIPRRRAAGILTTDALVAAILILYPRYLDPVTKLPCPPEILTERLAVNPVPQETVLTRARRLQGRVRRGLGRLGLGV